MKRLRDAQSRGVPLLLYSPSSTVRAKRGENRPLVRERGEKNRKTENNKIKGLHCQSGGLSSKSGELSK